MLACNYVVAESQGYQPEELNKKAVAITQRVKQKLTGKCSVLALFLLARFSDVKILACSTNGVANTLYPSIFSMKIHNLICTTFEASKFGSYN